MVAQRGRLLEPTAQVRERDHTAYCDRNANYPYKLVRLTADGEKAEHTQQFQDVGEWIMQMDAVYPIGGWHIIVPHKRQRAT